MSSPIWTNCWSQTRAACGTTILKHYSRDRDERDFHPGLGIGKGAAAGAARLKCSQDGSATTRPESEQSSRAMDRDASGRSTNISKERRALDADGPGRKESDARAGTGIPRAS